jgi:protein tyrosine phosphatase
MLGLENPKLPWYNQPKTNTLGFRLNHQYSNILVTSAPMMDGLTLKSAKNIDHYVNVSASEFEMNSYNKELNAQFHWFPLSEAGFVGFETIYGFIKTMDKIWTPENQILVHCEAGCNRSPTMTYLWLLKRENTIKDLNNYIPNIENWKDKIDGNIEKGFIPSIPDLKYFNKLIRTGTSLENICLDEHLEKYTTGLIPGKK